MYITLFKPQSFNMNKFNSIGKFSKVTVEETDKVNDIERFIVCTTLTLFDPYQTIL